MTLQELIANLGGFSAVVAAIAWLIRSLAGQVLSRDIEHYKSHLTQVTEQFKADLTREVKEHEIRFITLHEQRRTAVAEIYVLLAEMLSVHQTVGFIAQAAPDRLAKEVDRTFRSLNRLSEQLVRNRIYFTQPFADEIELRLERLTRPVLRLTTVLLNHKPEDAAVASLVEEVGNNNADAKALLTLVEEHFREILGVEAQTRSGDTRAV